LAPVLLLCWLLPWLLRWLLQDLFSIAVDQPFRFPATFTFVLRAFTTLEGIGASLDPNFSFAKVAAPYAQVGSQQRAAVLSFQAPFSNGQRRALPLPQ